MRRLLLLLAASLPAAAAQDARPGDERPADLIGRVAGAFVDDPVTLLTVTPHVASRSGASDGVVVYIRRETRVVYVDLPRGERRPAAGLLASIWLKEGSRDEAVRVEFRRHEAPAPEVRPLPRASGIGTVLEVESFEIDGGEVRDLAGAGGGKAVYFARPGGRARGGVRLDRGIYEFEVHLQGRSVDHDAVYLTVDRQEYRFYQDAWGRVAPGKVLGAGQALFEIPGDGSHQIVLEAAESEIHVDRVVISRLERDPGTPDPFRPDAEGFLRDWLVLAPIPSRGEKSGAREVEERQLENEAGLRPREGQSLRVRDAYVVWRRYRAANPFLDLKDFVRAEAGRWEDAVAYAVCAVWSDEEREDLELRMGSNDQAKVYLNGDEVLKHVQTRTLRPDESVAKGVSLAKGENLIVFKVANEKNDWGGCLRFAHKDGRPVRDLRVGIPPPRPGSGGGR